MKKKLIVAVLFVLSLAIGIPMYVKSQTNPHATLTYTGSATCVSCHDPATDSDRRQGHAQYITNGPSIQGKLHTAFNSY